MTMGEISLYDDCVMLAYNKEVRENNFSFINHKGCYHIISSSFNMPFSILTKIRYLAK